jgi:hypothetical protein
MMTTEDEGNQPSGTVTAGNLLPNAYTLSKNHVQ